MDYEDWKLLDPIKFGGNYQISTHGRVMNKDGKLLKQKEEDGYKLVILSVGGKSKAYRVHRLVLETFVGPAPEDKPQTRHIDGKRDNNILSNLKWGTLLENHEDRRKHGTVLNGEDCTRSKLKESDVRELLTLVKRLMNERGIKPSTLINILEGENWKYLYKEIILENA